MGELIREVDELAVFNDEAHHIHNPKMAWFKSIQDIHYRMLQRDGRLPALNDQTPREAASTEEGRDLLESLLLYYESHEDEPYDNLMRPDVAALRRELGIRGQDESRGGKKGRPAAS